MPTYRITHETVFTHAAPASEAWQTVLLRPREEAGQTCDAFRLDVRPAAPEIVERTDFFGNLRHSFSVRVPHRELSVTSHSVVTRDLSPPGPTRASPTVAQARAWTDDRITQPGGYRLEQFRHPTPSIPFLPDLADLAAEAGTEDTALLSWVERLGICFAEHFTFDPLATDVETPLAEVLRSRRGVCQDFTHLFLACLRPLGLPAAYVSGYLLTHPPEGQARLRGADAMHAWVSLHVPDIGWVDYDPTNTCFVGSAHIVIARGRDYADISPTRGVFTGSTPPPPRVGVTVEPMGR